MLETCAIIMAGKTGINVNSDITPVHAEGVSDPDSLSYARPRPAPKQDISQSSRKAVVTKDSNSKKFASFTSMVGSQEVYISRVRCDQQLPLGHPGYVPGHGGPHSTTRALLGAREKHIKNLEALLEAEGDMKETAEAKNVELVKELESLHVQLSDIQVSNHLLSEQLSTLQAQVTREENIKSAFEQFKKYEDDQVSSRYAEMDARLDALSIDFNEELYPHMLTMIASRRWVIGHGLRLAIMKCAESTKLRQVFADVVSAGIAKGMSERLKHGVEHEKAKVELAAIEAYDPEADTKYVAALHALKDLKYSLVDQLEKLKDAPIDVIMSSLFLESDSEEDAP
nr:hypothetical protein [Tanacetum cinerariifolium]